MIIGALWYSNLFLGRYWSKASKIKKSKANGNRYLINFVTTFIVAYALGYLMALAELTTTFEGMIMGAVVWLGFIGTTSLEMVLWEKKPIKLYIIQNAHKLIMLVVMGAILSL